MYKYSPWNVNIGFWVLGAGLRLKIPRVSEEMQQLELTHIIGGESGLTVKPANISISDDSEIPLKYERFIEAHVQRSTGTLIKALFVARMEWKT